MRSELPIPSDVFRRRLAGARQRRSGLATFGIQGGAAKDDCGSARDMSAIYDATLLRRAEVIAGRVKAGSTQNAYIHFNSHLDCKRVASWLQERCSSNRMVSTGRGEKCNAAIAGADDARTGATGICQLCRDRWAAGQIRFFTTASHRQGPVNHCPISCRVRPCLIADRMRTLLRGSTRLTKSASVAVPDFVQRC